MSDNALRTEQIRPRVRYSTLTNQIQILSYHVTPNLFHNLRRSISGSRRKRRCKLAPMERISLTQYMGKRVREVERELYLLRLEEADSEDGQDMQARIYYTQSSASEEQVGYREKGRTAHDSQIASSVGRGYGEDLRPGWTETANIGIKRDEAKGPPKRAIAPSLFLFSRLKVFTGFSPITPFIHFVQPAFTYLSCHIKHGGKVSDLVVGNAPSQLVDLKIEHGRVHELDRVMGYIDLRRPTHFIVNLNSLR